MLAGRIRLAERLCPTRHLAHLSRYEVVPVADDGQSCGVANGAGLQGGVDDHGGVQQSGAPHIVCSSGHTPLVSDDHTDSSGHTPLVTD